TRLGVGRLGRLGRVLPSGPPEDELEQDAVLLAKQPVLLDPGREPLPLDLRDVHGTPADDHEVPPLLTTAPGPARWRGSGTRKGRRTEAQRWRERRRPLAPSTDLAAARPVPELPARRSARRRGRPRERSGRCPTSQGRSARTD